MILENYCYEPGDPSVKSPIKFLGLWDTVGAFGIPTYTIGRGFDYLKLHNQNISNVVRHARQALAIHEKISFFEPCHIFTNSTSSVTIKETWFPEEFLEAMKEYLRQACCG
jgi:hypothetical protein